MVVMSVTAYLCVLFSFVTSFPRVPSALSKYRQHMVTFPDSLEYTYDYTDSDGEGEDGSPLFFQSNTISQGERISRTASFYSAVLPLVAKYKLLQSQISFQRNGGGDISEEEEEKLYDEIHEWGSQLITEKIKELKGFYVKTGQIISTRVDIFPKQYTEKLALTQDALDPLPGDVIKAIVKQELTNGADLSELFSEFDDKCLGSASIAQVHKAKLLDGRTVAVKVQKPGIEGKFLGDLANIKRFAKVMGESLLIDYYKIFVEVEKTAKLELDFLFEAQATVKVASAVAHSPSNKPRKAPVIVPLPLNGLVTRRVMVLEYVDGIALSKVAEEMQKRGVQAGSIESIALGKRLLTALTDAFASMIFGSGIVHGDPHPGNIFLLDGGDVALLDCGQVKQISNAQRIGLAKLVILVNKWEKVAKRLQSQAADGSLDETDPELSTLTTELAVAVRQSGVTLKNEDDSCAAAVALLLFGNTETKLPGGYAGEEISPNSPIVQVAEFPSEYILLGRASVMIKGIAKRLGTPWGLSDRWFKDAQEAVLTEEKICTPTSSMDECKLEAKSEFMPIWAVTSNSVPTTYSRGDSRKVAGKQELQLKDIMYGFRSNLQLLRQYFAKIFYDAIMKYLPKSASQFLLRTYLRFTGEV